MKKLVIRGDNSIMILLTLQPRSIVRIVASIVLGALSDAGCEPRIKPCMRS